MLFTTPTFLTLFLPIVLIINIFLKPSFRNTWLFVASLLFYTWGEGLFSIIMLLSISANYIFGYLIENSTQPNSKIFLILAVVCNLALLAYFKYANFFIENLSGVSVFNLNANSKIHLPLGISFFTFESISYCCDVYRKESRSQKSLLNYGLFVSFFPHLIAGPIVKYHTLSDQIENRSLTPEQLKSGILRFTFGLFKKFCIANHLALIADMVFDKNLENLSSLSAWVAILAYTLQIYFDFSGYSDMAIGLARMFGFRFLENFNYPYISKSIREFWKRWHISLSTWFRDYLYIPLGGNRNGNFNTYRNLLIVFLCTGLWHGASWNFLFWGLYHGFFIIIEKAGFMKKLPGKYAFISHVYFLLVVMVGWVFFRIESFNDAMLFIEKLAFINSGENLRVISFLDNFHVFVLVTAVILSTPILESLRDKWKILKQKWSNEGFIFPGWAEEIALFSCLVLVMFINYMEMATDTYNPFIYFRF